MATITLNGTSDDLDIVRSIMLFPNDEALRNHYLKMLDLNDQISATADGESITIAVDDLKSALAGPSWMEVKSLATEAVKGGTIVGDLLATIYIMDAFKDRHDAFADPSFGKALHVIEKFAIGERFGDETPLPYSEGTIRKRWTEFESVAHLWAATRLNQDYPFCEPGAWQHSVEACHKMLAAAAGILKFGTNYIPKRTKPPKPVVDPVKAWAIPASVGSSRLESERLPDKLAEYLKSFKA